MGMILSDDNSKEDVPCIRRKRGLDNSAMRQTYVLVASLFAQEKDLLVTGIADYVDKYEITLPVIYLRQWKVRSAEYT